MCFSYDPENRQIQAADVPCGHFGAIKKDEMSRILKQSVRPLILSNFLVLATLMLPAFKRVFNRIDLKLGPRRLRPLDSVLGTWINPRRNSCFCLEQILAPRGFCSGRPTIGCLVGGANRRLHIRTLLGYGRMTAAIRTLPPDNGNCSSEALGRLIGPPATDTIYSFSLTTNARTKWLAGEMGSLFGPVGFKYINQPVADAQVRAIVAVSTTYRKPVLRRPSPSANV